VAYVFNFREPVPTLRDLSQAVMREVVGDRTVDEVLTIGRQEMETRCAERLRELVATLNMGVRIDQMIRSSSATSIRRRMCRRVSAM
jgi:membrane protease subunit HflK